MTAVTKWQYVFWSSSKQRIWKYFPLHRMFQVLGSLLNNSFEWELFLGLNVSVRLSSLNSRVSQLTVGGVQPPSPFTACHWNMTLLPYMDSGQNGTAGLPSFFLGALQTGCRLWFHETIPLRLHSSTA